jgi:polyribonucleotide nucleotidyltransferase
MYKLFKKDINLGDGRVITIETGKLAKQAHGSVVVRMGNTMLLATVVSAKEMIEDVDFMPLSVEYKENFSAMGRFPGGFLRREGRPGDNQILVARLVDRVLRPLFPKDYHAETFVTVNLISADKDVMPDALAGLAASAALTISDVPFDGPISEVRVARVDGKLLINPTQEENQRADIEILVGATKDDIMMVEGEMGEVSEADMLEAIRLAHEVIKIQCQAQIELAQEIGNVVKRDYPKSELNEDLYKKLKEFSYSRIYEIAKSAMPKKERSNAFDAIKEEFIATIPEEEQPDLAFSIKQYYHDIEREAVRNLLLDEKIRLDGRKPDQIRPIWCEVDYLPVPHGSAIFTRGETQSLTTVTLGTKLDEKIIDEVMEQGRDRFLLHYNFPPFSTGDAKPERGVSRREVGHGNLAHRALKRMLPPEDEIPYTVRVVSTILESNGSSSMATVCAGTLALLDSGIKMRRPVSGIAMGLVMDEKGRYEVLSDILGDEDHLGDMDFKVTGTEKGITACQMDIKINGLSYEVLEKALHQANKGRAHILSIMLETISEPRADYKPHVPRIEKIFIPKDMIGAIIGPGGKIIQEIQSTTGTVIVIEEKDDQGIVLISAADKNSIEAAKQKIRGIVEVPEIGSVYTGKVKSIVAFGAFVEILPGKDGLLHISEIEWRRLNTVDEVLKEGQMIEVKLIEIDKKSGKLKLSRKALLPKPEGK